jgi:riboflavin kinase / FMN adenylyltransferase
MQKHNQYQIQPINFFELRPKPFTHSWVTIGNFDGVHLGHQAIIQKMVHEAGSKNLPVIVVTFYPDPSDYFNPKRAAFYLTSPEEKQAKLCHLGADHVLTLQFDKRLSGLTAQEFLLPLKQKLGMTNLVIGRDFALGKNRQGTLPVIQSLGKAYGFDVEMVEPVQHNGEEISSTRIRRLLDQGEVDKAGALLGHPYAISGPVTQGSDRGSRIGLPTANIVHWPKKQLPGVGVYATHVFHQEKRYFGITNVGLRPTFEEQELPNIETHILDFDGNIYGEDLELHFVQKIREEKKFPGVEAFLEQISRDKSTARKIFSNDQT